MALSHEAGKGAPDQKKGGQDGNAGAQKTGVASKLALNVYKLDKEPHIRVKKEMCRNCRVKYCLYVCPAGLFTLDEKGDIKFDYEGCLECGTCLIACRDCAIDWNYPKGGFGVQYRFG